MYKASNYNIIVEDCDNKKILFNSFRGSLVRIDKECHQDLISMNENSKYKSAFLDQGFWIPINHSELDEMRSCPGFVVCRGGILPPTYVRAADSRPYDAQSNIFGTQPIL